MNGTTQLRVLHSSAVEDFQRILSSMSAHHRRLKIQDTISYASSKQEIDTVDVQQVGTVNVRNVAAVIDDDDDATDRDPHRSY